MTDPSTVDVREIDSRDDLIAFIQALSHDFESNAEAWKNVTIGSFLEAMSRWLESADNWANNMIRLRPELWLDVDTPSWQLFARALRVARTYE
jgi:hypothetical protein